MVLTQYIWIIDDVLAVSPLPSLSDIEELSRIFNGVVVLIQPHEVMGYIDYYLDKWRQYGVEVYYAPTPDFHPVELLELHRISEWIDRIIRENGKVLIHCMGGVGRSGMTAMAYLLYKGYSFTDALRIVSSKRPGAPGNIGQQRVLEDYYILLKILGVRELSKHIKYVEGDMFKHVSKTIQYMIELTDYLGISIDKDEVIAAFHHCEDKDAIEKLRSIDLLNDNTYRILQGYFEKNMSFETLLLELVHKLDYYRDGRLVFIDHEEVSNTHYLILLCDLDCTWIINETKELFNKLSSIIGLRIVVEPMSYLEYV